MVDSKNPSRSSNIVWPYLTITGVVVYIIIDVALSHLRPDYSLLHNAESDYGRGPYFWLMDINFLIRCAFSLTLLKSLREVFPKDIFVKKASYWLMAWAIASGLLAFFADNPYGYPHLWSGSVHLLLAFIAFISVLVGMVLLSRQLINVREWRKTGNILVVLTVLAFIFILLLGHTGFRPHRLGGLYERLFLGSVILWEALIAIRIIIQKYGDKPQ